MGDRPPRLAEPSATASRRIPGPPRACRWCASPWPSAFARWHGPGGNVDRGRCPAAAVGR